MRHQFSVFLGKKMKSYLLVCALLLSPSAIAEDNQYEDKQYRVYFGAGSVEPATATMDAARPLSIGFLTLPDPDTGIFYGVDLGIEGIMLDSTYGRYKVPEQGVSFNGIVGRSFGSESFAFDFGLLVGSRQTERSCPPSGVGYQCYADQDPDVSYAINYGALATLNFNDFFVGIRTTEVSQQTIIGVSF